MHTGIYIWDTEESMLEFGESDLAKTIPEAYQVEASPRVEVFEVIFPLRQTGEPAGTDAEFGCQDAVERCWRAASLKVSQYGNPGFEAC